MNRSFYGKRLRVVLKRIYMFVLMFAVLFSIAATPTMSTPLSVSEVRIAPEGGGFEDPSTNEWRGSFWIITATTDTKESYMLYRFNQSQSENYGQNEIDGKTIVPTAEIEIRITPRQPFWERQLEPESYLVYNRTYGTHRDYLTKQVSKLLGDSVPPLFADVLQCESDAVWILHTPFDITIKKTGDNPFTKTETIDTFGGTDSIVITNPDDNSEKLMITTLSKSETGYGQPSMNRILIFNETIAFEKTTPLVKVIEFGKNSAGITISDECFAFYWFGGGPDYLAIGDEGKRDEEVLYWEDDHSCMHAYRWGLGFPLGKNNLLTDGDFPGSYRDDPGGIFPEQEIKPIPAKILTDNNSTNPPGLSLVNYLVEKAGFGTMNLNAWNEGWDITSNYKLRIYLPNGAASSLITMKISTELADSVVYRPLAGDGRIDQFFWDSTKTTKASIVDTDMAVLKVKQWASNSSKVTVTASVPVNTPVSITPQKDAAIIEPMGVYTSNFEVSNLGVDAKQDINVTFTVTNDLGTVTDSVVLELELLPFTEASSSDTSGDLISTGGSQILDSSDPLFAVLVVVIVIVIGAALAYSVRDRLFHIGRKTLKQSET